MPDSPQILVTGDVVVDHNIYIGERTAPVERDRRGRHETRTLGGAMLTYKLLETLRKVERDAQEKAREDAKAEGRPEPKPKCIPEVHFGLTDLPRPDSWEWPPALTCGGLWQPFPVSSDKKDKNRGLVWRLAEHLGYGDDDERSQAFHPGARIQSLNDPGILVIDDGGVGFRSAGERYWPSTAQLESARWVILKMSRPLARGELWQFLTATCRRKLILLISADDLRREDVHLGRGLSWETTAENFAQEIDSNPSLNSLSECRHVVVMMRGDATLWLDNTPSNKHQTLVFDRIRGEGESEEARIGKSFGFLSGLAASVAWHVANWEKEADQNVDLVPALRCGLSAASQIQITGHGPVRLDGNPAFPFTDVAREIFNPSRHFGASKMPTVEGQGRGVKTILEMACRPEFVKDQLTGPLLAAARRLVLYGPSGLPNVPSARFGKLLTYDRREIECLRTFRQLMMAYKNAGDAKPPLSLAVFGAPGSGKCFGVKQIGEAVFGEDNDMPVFNLSQFEGPDQLAGAFHQVRDSVVIGETPIVFWDEFDSGSFKWLQYFLAPMLDGVFQDGQRTHAIGKCVFVFAGGTSRDYEHFGPAKNRPEEEREWVLRKGNDFRSRLAAYLDVPGPNRRQKFVAGQGEWIDDPEDIDFPVRRALLIRAALKTGDQPGEGLIDSRLLAALLEVRRYPNGARSIENLVLHMKEQGGVPLRPAYLPPRHVLEMLVGDAGHFYKLMKKYDNFQEIAETLAPFVHEDWRAGLSEIERDTNPNAKEFQELPEEIRYSNAAAARRIPEILSLADLALERSADSPEDEEAAAKLLEHEIEALANAEHEGWMKQKRASGWTFGENRDEVNLKHPSLRPYSELKDSERNKDRAAVRNYAQNAQRAGFKIVPVKATPTV